MGIEQCRGQGENLPLVRPLSVGSSIFRYGQIEIYIFLSIDRSIEKWIVDPVSTIYEQERSLNIHFQK